MPKKCPDHCVSKKRYNDLLVENRALKDKIKALEMGKLPVKKINSSDPIDSGSAGFDTASSYLSPTSSDFVSPLRYRSRAETRRGGKKKKSKKGRKGKTVKRMKG